MDRNTLPRKDLVSYGDTINLLFRAWRVYSMQTANSKTFECKKNSSFNIWMYHVIGSFCVILCHINSLKLPKNFFPLRWPKIETVGELFLKSIIYIYIYIYIYIPLITSYYKKHLKLLNDLLEAILRSRNLLQTRCIKCATWQQEDTE